MHKPNVAILLRSARTFATKHSPEILTGIGIAGMITTTVLAVRATPKALVIIDELREMSPDREGKVSPVDVVKATWTYYLPAAITGTASVACLVGANSVNLRRNAALAAAYKLSETALTEYKDKVVETLGEKKEKVIRENVVKEKMEKNPPSKSEIIITEKGETQCYDPLSDRYFKSDIEAIKRAENAINKRLLHDISGYASVNDFYDELGLPHTDVGDMLGWNSDNLMDLDLVPHLGDNGIPSIAVSHHVRPRYDYY